MSSKNNQNRPKTLLTIVEGGERTYIHPYSYSENGKNSIHFLRAPEFPPHQVGQVNWFIPYQVGYIKRVWNFVRRVAAVLKRCGPGLSGLRYFSIMWDCTIPVYCTDIYSGPTITTPGTLTPSHAGSKLTESYYLIPSQERLKSKLREWLFAPDLASEKAFLSEKYSPLHRILYPVWITYHEHERNSYLTWARKQVEWGRKIGFLSSLDT